MVVITWFKIIEPLSIPRTEVSWLTPEEVRFFVVQILWPSLQRDITTAVVQSGFWSRVLGT